MSESKISHYNAVLSDLKAERKDLDIMIARIEQRIATLKGETPRQNQVADTSNFPLLEEPFVANTVLQNLGVSDIAELILKQAGQPLHATVILENLHARGRTQTTIKSLTGTMPQDARKRFENLGKNVWALTRWPEETKKPFRAVAKKSELVDES